MTSRTRSKSDFSVTILSGQTTSSAEYVKDNVFCGFILPAAFTGTTVTFQGSLDGTTYYDLYDISNSALSSVVTQGRAYSLNVVNFPAWPYIKIVSGSAEGGDRDIILLTAKALED